MTEHVCVHHNPWDRIMVAEDARRAVLFSSQDWYSEAARINVDWCPFCGKALTEKALSNEYGEPLCAA